MHCQGYNSEHDILREVDDFLFGNNADLIDELVVMEELVDPSLVSYAYDMAAKYYDLIHQGRSPAIIPCDGNDLGGYGLVYDLVEDCINGLGDA